MNNNQPSSMGLFSQNMQKPNTGGTPSGLFTPKTMPSGAGIFNSNPSNQGGMFSSTQPNNLNQGGIFNKGLNNAFSTNVHSFNNTPSNSSKLVKLCLI